MHWPDLFPPMALRMTCGDLTVSVLTPDDVPELLDLAVRGVVPESATVYPFLTDWAKLPASDLRANSTAWYFSAFASWTKPSPERWSLLMVVREAGRVVGCQDLMGKSFAVTRLAETGSWLGLEHQGRGIGTRMRQMVCAFAFDHLGATELRTDAFKGNAASRRVSEKVGYQLFDEGPVDQMGDLAHSLRFRLTEDRLVRPIEPLVVEGVDAVRTFVGL